MSNKQIKTLSPVKTVAGENTNEIVDNLVTDIDLGIAHIIDEPIMEPRLSLDCGFRTSGREYINKPMDAADMNNEVATDLVSDCFREGIGVTKDAKKAQKYSLRSIRIIQDNPWMMG